jgi:hypothetical protein
MMAIDDVAPPSFELSFGFFVGGVLAVISNDLLLGLLFSSVRDRLKKLPVGKNSRVMKLLHGLRQDNAIT